MFAYKNKKRHKKIKQHFNNSTKATHNAKGKDDIQTVRKQHKGTHMHTPTYTQIYGTLTCVCIQSKRECLCFCVAFSVSG